MRSLFSFEFYNASVWPHWWTMFTCFLCSWNCSRVILLDHTGFLLCCFLSEDDMFTHWFPDLSIYCVICLLLCNIVKDSADWISFSFPTQTIRLYSKPHNKDPLMWLMRLNQVHFDFKPLWRWNPMQKMYILYIFMSFTPVCVCVCPLCVCRRLSLALVTSWIVSMLCQVARHTLSNFMVKNLKQHSHWNVISLT